MTDTAAPVFARGLAFYKLVKLWAACRTNDLSGLNPASLSLKDCGLVGWLERTKTSGPGKRVRHLPIFVSSAAGLFTSKWLQVGWDIWQRESMRFDRDYFLPLPTDDWSGAQRIMADYADAAALSKHLLRQLRQPVKTAGQWTLSHTPLLAVDAIGSFWSEHSERNWLISMLAAIGVPPEERKYVGRWGVSSADEYLRTAQRVIFSLQERLVAYFCGRDTQDLRLAGLDELEGHLRQREVPESARQQQLQALTLSADWCNRASPPAEPQVPDSAEPAVEADDVGDNPYFVTIVGKRRLRRLHRTGGCGVTMVAVNEAEPVWHLRGLAFDLACRHCWRPGEATVSEAEEADDSEGSEDP